MKRAEIEDLLRTTLAIVAHDELGQESVDTVTKQASRPVMEILGAEHEDVSKGKSARALIRCATNGTAALTEDGRRASDSFVTAANKALN